MERKIVLWILVLWWSNTFGNYTRLRPVRWNTFFIPTDALTMMNIIIYFLWVLRKIYYEILLVLFTTTDIILFYFITMNSEFTNPVRVSEPIHFLCSCFNTCIGLIYSYCSHYISRNFMYAGKAHPDPRVILQEILR